MNDISHKVAELESVITKLQKANTNEKRKFEHEIADLTSKVSRLEQQNRDAESKVRNLESEMRRLK